MVQIQRVDFEDLQTIIFYLSLIGSNVRDILVNIIFLLKGVV